MMLFRRKGILVLAVCVLAAVAMSGCSKKTQVPDVTQDDNTGMNNGNDNGSDNTNNTTPEAPHDVVEENASLQDVFFDYDDYSLSAEARSKLAGDASYLKEMSGLRVTIEGHCDERGTVEYNLALGQRRADAARSYLMNLGIDADRLATVSYGEERPFDPGHDEAAWKQNRRAHFRVNR